MLSIGEFSNICKVSCKTLRYYAAIGLLMPDEISERGYRYYSIEQLEKMLFINRLKSYDFSLEEIKQVLNTPCKEDALSQALLEKERQLQNRLQEDARKLQQLQEDREALLAGKSILSYMADIDLQLVEVANMHLLSIRKMVQEKDMQHAYEVSYQALFTQLQKHHYTICLPPMVLFHSAEYTSEGMDVEFALAIKEYASGTREFHPGLCLKCVHQGSYSELVSIYTKQIEWAKQEGYKNEDALFEIYVSDPSQSSDATLCTEVYYPVKKIKQK